MNNNINEIFNQKDKRISYLSILHSLAILHQGQNLSDEKLSEFATKLTDNLFVKYPTPSDNTPALTPKPATAPLNANRSGLKQSFCPVCGSVGIRNDAGKLKNAKAPDFKCSKGCKFSWDKQTRQYQPSEYITGWWQPREEDIARANYQDSVDDESHKHYQNEHPDQQYGEFGEPL